VEISLAGGPYCEFDSIDMQGTLSHLVLVVFERILRTVYLSGLRIEYDVRGVNAGLLARVV